MVCIKIDVKGYKVYKSLFLQLFGFFLNIKFPLGLNQILFIHVVKQFVKDKIH